MIFISDSGSHLFLVLSEVKSQQSCWDKFLFHMLAPWNSKGSCKVSEIKANGTKMHWMTQVTKLKDVQMKTIPYRICINIQILKNNLHILLHPFYQFFSHCPLTVDILACKTHQVSKQEKWISGKKTKKVINKKESLHALWSPRHTKSLKGSASSLGNF